MGNNEDDIRKFFEDKLKRSGHSLENNVEKKLSRIFKIEREPPYLDKDENKGRFGDMLGYAFFPDISDIPQRKKVALGQLMLVVECKNIPDNGWIFFENKNEDLGFPECFSFIRTREKDPILESIPIETFPELFPASGFYEAAIKGIIQQPQTNRKEKNLFEAIMTVIKSTRHQIDETDKFRRSLYRYFNQLEKVVFVTIFQPLIVFTGRMYSTNENESDLKPIKYAQLKKRYESAKYNETMGTIHIVHYDAIDEYIDILRNIIGLNQILLFNTRKKF